MGGVLWESAVFKNSRLFLQSCFSVYGGKRSAAVSGSSQGLSDGRLAAQGVKLSELQGAKNDFHMTRTSIIN